MNKISNNFCSLLKNNHGNVKCMSVSILRVQKINTRASDADAETREIRDEDAHRSIAHIHSHWTKQFKKAGISEPRESIQYILAHIFQFNKISDLYRKFSYQVDVQTQKQIEVLCKKRLSSMPVQYIIGEWQFRDVILKMESPVFIPRPETEKLIDLILEDFEREGEKKRKILEICCGSGAISLALLKHNSNIEITAVDKSREACNLTHKNALLHELSDRISIRNYEINEENLLQDIDIPDEFDLIVSNPPYVPTKDVQDVQPEIRLFEDLDALDGGPDGLNIIKTILLISKEKLIKNGKLYLETDPSHPLKISHFIASHPELRLKFQKSHKDFCNKERFVTIAKI